MAKKPDFAQKLLDDLRLKKEWMANSQNSSRLMAEKYRDFKHPCGESREIGSMAQDMIRWSSNSTRSFATGEPSSELVPVGRVRSSEHIADLSMALAFALKNGVHPGRKYSSTNMVGFPNHLRGKSLDFRERGGGFNLDKRQPLNGPFPTLSHLHVKEISRGAQKLNQILTACYNGINFDIYPIDIAKELLKGAIDLEESLKMLVELQEASEYMISPQRKQKIRLLELEDHNDDLGDKVNKQKQLDRPSFSFDPPSRKSLEYMGGSNQNSAKQKLPTLSYPKETGQVSSRKQAPSASKLATHRRSSSCGPDFSTALSLSTPTKHSSLSDSRPDRGRIPNIIAKLMGLEELPPSKESVGAQKEPHVDQGARSGNNLKKNLQRSTKKCEPLSLDSDKFARTATQKIRQDHSNSSVPETSIIVYADKIESTQNHFERDVGERKCRVSKITEHTDILSNSKKSTIKKNKLEISTSPVHSHWVSKSLKKKRDEDPQFKEQMNKRRAEASKVILKERVQKVAQPTHKSSETATAKLERRGTQKDAVYKEKRSANYRFMVAHNLEKHLHPSHPANTIQKSKFEDAKFQQTYSEQPKAKQQLQVRNRSEKMLQHSSITTHDSKGLQKMLPLINHAVPGKNTSKESSDAMPTKVLMGRSHHEDLSGERYATRVGHNKQRGRDENVEEQRSFTRSIETNVQNVTAPSAPALIKQPQQIPSSQKVDNAQVHKSVNPRELEEAVVKENVTPCNIDQSLKEQFTVVEEPKQSRHSSNETEESIFGSKETEASIKLLNSTKELQKYVDCTSFSSSLTEEESPRLNKLETYGPNATIEDNTTNISSSQEARIVSPNETQTLMSSNVLSAPIEGFHDNKNVEISSLQDQQAVPKIDTPRTLTENQNYLKQILVRSQLFLNAAEALFGLQIPVEVLHSTRHKYPPDEDNKVLLDCGYEVLRRKGRRKEFTFHPWATISIGAFRIMCLDDLVEELHEDFENLKFRTENGSNEHDPAKSLHELLQKDIQGSKPDVNCMWDLGWGEAMFTYLEKDEVIKGVEKYVLNGLLDDVTGDLLHVKTVF